MLVGLERFGMWRVGCGCLGFDVQHDHGDGKGAFCLEAVAVVSGGASHVAGFGNVPGDWHWVLRVRVVGAGLGVDAEGPETDDDGVYYAGENWPPHVHDEHDELDEEDEHGEDGDDNVEGGGARGC